ncbi:hypothetical protein SUGI_0986730 [Cryptomeria japonica]|nr:hypothetical protein SUGI_0986730 [Cryptomeria japonica]
MNYSLERRNTEKSETRKRESSEWSINVRLIRSNARLSLGGNGIGVAFPVVSIHNLLHLTVKLCGGEQWRADPLHISILLLAEGRCHRNPYSQHILIV